MDTENSQLPVKEMLTTANGPKKMSRALLVAVAVVVIVAAFWVWHEQQAELACLEFVDRQGTSDVFSDLTIQQTDGINYLVSIGIFRLTNFKGKAVMQDALTYEFEDENLRVKGTIRLLNNSTKAIFEVTESDWEYVKAGDVFQFPKRK